MRRGNSFTGMVLILLGLVFLVSRYLFGYELIHFESGDFWPIIVLMAGVMFELVYFVSGKAPGLLVPGGIITTCAALFFFEVATDWRFAAYTWPVYIFAVAIGLFQLYLFSGRPRGLMVAVGIIAGVGAVSAIAILFKMFLSSFDFALVVPVILIVIGLFMIVGRRKAATGGEWH